MSDSVKKTIQINPELFKVSSSGSKSKSRTQKNRPKPRANPLKKELMSKIKSHAQKNKKTMKDGKDFASNFEEHMSYLNDLVEKKKKLKIHTVLPAELQKPSKPVVSSTVHVTHESDNVNETVPKLVSQSKPVPDSVPMSEPLPVPMSVLEPEPMFEPLPVPMSVPVHEPVSVPVPEPESVPVSMPMSVLEPKPVPVPVPVHEPESVTAPVKNDFYKNPNELETAPFVLKKEPPYGNLKIGGKKPTYRSWNQTRKVRPTLKTKIPVIERTQEIRKKFTLGRNKNKNKVTVFLKNNKTRRKINDEITSAQQKPINEIKEYLRKQNLIKAGSEAPSDILRKLYKESLLAGEIKNKNTNTLMHNYLSEDEN